MEQKRIAAEWEAYRRAVVPANAGPAQVQDTKMAFYGGASAMLAVLVGVLEPGTDPTAKDLRVMDEIAAELEEHAKSCAHARA